MVDYGSYNVDPLRYQSNAFNQLAGSIEYKDRRSDIERSNAMSQRQMQLQEEQQSLDQLNTQRQFDRQSKNDDIELIGVQAGVIKRALQSVDGPQAYEGFKNWMATLAQSPLGDNDFFRNVLKMVPEQYDQRKVQEGITGLDALSPDKIEKQGFSEAELTQRAIQGDKMAQQILDRMSQRKKETARAGASNVNVDVGGKSMVELGKEMSKGLVAERTDVEGAVRSLQNLQEAKNLLDSGMITGTGAEFLTNAGNLLASRLGFEAAEDPVANTQAFAATMGQQVGQIIKQFGSGTGLSDADREYAEKIVGGKITLNENAIRKLFAINEKGYRNVIKMFNKKASQAMRKKGSESLPYDLRVEMPKPVKPKTRKTAPNEAIEYLRQNPKLKNAFKEKYGYLPEGF